MKTLILTLLALTGTVHAAGTVFSTILSGSGQDYANAVTSDAQGNTYAGGLTYSKDFPVTAGAFQTTFGGTCDAFVAKVGPDGKLIWATYLGGILDDWVSSIAVDGAGNVWVAGYTRSANFPLVNPIQSTLGDDFDAFVAKLDPTGSKLLYSTFLGGQGENGAGGMVLDSAGNAYAAVNVSSTAGYPGVQNAPGQFGIFVSKLTPRGALAYSYFHPNGVAAAIALDAAGSVYVAGSSAGYPINGLATNALAFDESGPEQAMLFKISPDGSSKLYETTLGGSVQTVGAAIAVDGAGEAWMAGTTLSADFPLVKPLQSSTGGRPLWKSANGGSTWSPLDDLPFAVPQTLAVDPADASTLYQATEDLGIFKSVDGSATWSAANTGIAGGPKGHPPGGPPHQETSGIVL